MCLEAHESFVVRVVESLQAIEVEAYSGYSESDEDQERDDGTLMWNESRKLLQKPYAERHNTRSDEHFGVLWGLFLGEDGDLFFGVDGSDQEKCLEGARKYHAGCDTEDAPVEMLCEVKTRKNI